MPHFIMKYRWIIELDNASINLTNSDYIIHLYTLKTLKTFTLKTFALENVFLEYCKMIDETE